MSCELDVLDCFGRRVLLDHSNWEKHLTRRPDLIPYRERFAEVLSRLDAVIQAERDGALHFYRTGIGEGKFANLYLRIVIGRYSPVDKIKSWWFCTTVDPRGTELQCP